MRILCALSAAIAISACSGSVGRALDTRRNAGPCPTVGAVYEASRVVQFDGDREIYSNIAYTGEVVGVRLSCIYVEDNPIEATVEVDFAFGRGPKGAADEHVFEYFIAVTRRNTRVLNKEIFTVEADFDKGPVAGAQPPQARITIPRIEETISGGNFEVLVGFELTDQQLAFNRGGNRFRLDAGAPLEPDAG